MLNSICIRFSLVDSRWTNPWHRRSPSILSLFCMLTDSGCTVHGFRFLLLYDSYERERQSLTLPGPHVFLPAMLRFCRPYGTTWCCDGEFRRDAAVGEHAVSRQSHSSRNNMGCEDGCCRGSARGGAAQVPNARGDTCSSMLEQLLLLYVGPGQ